MNPPYPRSGEYFAPLPLLSTAMMVMNDVVLKPRFHDALTGKLSDVAVCFSMPLFLSELLGLGLAVRPRVRLIAAAVFTAAFYTALEVVPPFTRFTLAALAEIGPVIGVPGPFRMTSDVTDLYCLVLIPLAYLYGARRLDCSRVERTQPSVM